MYYMLDNNNKTVACDFETWAKLFVAPHHVGNEVVNGKHVSTVFLGIDHGLYSGVPLLFETMIFAVNGVDEHFCERCSTYEEALLTHEKALQIAQGE